MNHLPTRTLIGSIAGMLILSSCASVPADQVAWRAYQKKEHEQRFLAFRNACFDAGGTVIVQARQRLGPKAVPMPGDRYFCG